MTAETTLLQSLTRRHPISSSKLLASSRLLLVALAACSLEDGADHGIATAIVDTVAGGIARVRNLAPPVGADTIIAMLEPDAVFGTVDGGFPQPFGQVRDLAIDERGGQVLVLDSYNQTIVVFDSIGRYVRTIGRKGTGPGAFRDAIGVRAFSSGTIWVADAATSQYSTFNADGVLREQRRGTIARGHRWVGMVNHGTERILQVGLVSQDNELWQAILSHDLVTHVTDTSLSSRYSPNTFLATVNTHGHETTVAIPVPFTPACRSAIGASGYVWTSCDADYRFYKLSEQSDTVLIVEREYDRLPVTPGERQEALTQLRPLESRGFKIDEQRIPGTRPAIDQITVDHEDRVWVALSLPSALGQTVFDVFDASGTYLGQAWVDMKVLTRPQDPVVVTERHLFAVAVDSLDTPLVYRFKFDLSLVDRDR